MYIHSYPTSFPISISSRICSMYVFRHAGTQVDSPPAGQRLQPIAEPLDVRCTHSGCCCEKYLPSQAMCHNPLVPRNVAADCLCGGPVALSCSSTSGDWLCTLACRYSISRCDFSSAREQTGVPLTHTRVQCFKRTCSTYGLHFM